MTFTKHLHAAILAGEITQSVRIWQWPHVTVGKRYRFGPGAIEVTGLREMELDKITPALARRTGFEDVPSLLRVAKHGPGWRVFLVTFVYVPLAAPRIRSGSLSSRAGSKATGSRSTK